MNVNGGTSAGKRRPFNGAAPAWPHVCAGVSSLMPGYMARCFSCGAKRPN